MAHGIEDKRSKYTFALDTGIIDTWGKRLGPHGVAVYAVLARFAGVSSQTLSQQAIADTLGISRRQVGRSIDVMVEAGFVAITEIPAGNGYSYKRFAYTLLPVWG